MGFGLEHSGSQSFNYCPNALMIPYIAVCMDSLNFLLVGILMS